MQYITKNSVKNIKICINKHECLIIKSNGLNFLKFIGYYQGVCVIRFNLINIKVFNTLYICLKQTYEFISRFLNYFLKGLQC